MEYMFTTIITMMITTIILIITDHIIQAIIGDTDLIIITIIAHITLIMVDITEVAITEDITTAIGMVIMMDTMAALMAITIILIEIVMHEELEHLQEQLEIPEQEQMWEVELQTEM